MRFDSRFPFRFAATPDFRTLDRKSHKARVSFLVPNDFLVNALTA